jgi:DNA-binding MarR family transcriptional regulator
MKLDLDHYIPGLLLWVSNRLTSSASQLYRRRFDIGVTEWRVLAYFHIYPWTTAASACELMGIDKAAASRSVSSLSAAGYLASRPLGQRRVQYSLTDAGRKLHDEVVRVALDREKALMAGFSSQERTVLEGFLHRLLANTPALCEADTSAPARPR